jgi:hypothetical protein
MQHLRFPERTGLVFISSRKTGADPSDMCTLSVSACYASVATRVFRRLRKAECGVTINTNPIACLKRLWSADQLLDGDCLHPGVCEIALYVVLEPRLPLLQQERLEAAVLHGGAACRGLRSKSGVRLLAVLRDPAMSGCSQHRSNLNSMLKPCSCPDPQLASRRRHHLHLPCWHAACMCRFALQCTNATSCIQHCMGSWMNLGVLRPTQAAHPPLM